MFKSLDPQIGKSSKIRIIDLTKSQDPLNRPLSPKKDKYVVLGGGGLDDDDSGDADGRLPSFKQNPLLRLLKPNQNSRNLVLKSIPLNII